MVTFFGHYVLIYFLFENRMANFSLDGGLMGTDVHGKVSCRLPEYFEKYNWTVCDFSHPVCCKIYIDCWSYGYRKDWTNSLWYHEGVWC